MTEMQFFRRAAVIAAGLTLAVLLVDRMTPHEAAWVLPFGEPWLTILGGGGIWLGTLVVFHVGRWIYLIIRKRGPNLG